MSSIEIPSEGLRLNLGCGRHTHDGWFCVDAAQHVEATRDVDLISDLRRIDLPDDCASEIISIHAWEHFYPWECHELIVEWRRLLRRGGTLVLELPDLMKFCHNILIGRDDGKHPDQLGLWGAYGDPRPHDPLMMHKWGWTYRTLAKFLKHYKFVSIREEETQWHPYGRGTRDFRIVAVKA